MRNSPLLLLLPVFSFLLFPSGYVVAFDPCSEQDRGQYISILQRQEQGVLFRIEHCHTAPSYILGTIHSDSEWVWQTAKPARDIIISQVKSAGFEFIPPPNARELTAQYMYLPTDGDAGLLDIVGEDLYLQLVGELTKRGVTDNTSINKLKPWAAAVLLQMPPATGNGIILDSRLQQLAVKNGIEIYGLETMEEQFSLFDKLSAKEQLTMLIEAVGNIEETNRINSLLEEYYVSGELAAIEKLGKEAIESTKDRKLRHFFATELLVKRNVTMTKRMQKHLKEGNNLIAIGALHLPGEKGVLALLEKLGYFIFAVSDSQSKP